MPVDEKDKATGAQDAAIGTTPRAMENAPTAVNSTTNGEQRQTGDPAWGARYQSILGYLQYENTAFWTRSGFMSIAQSALIGFYVSAFLRQPVAYTWEWWVLIGTAIMGFLVAGAWFWVAVKGRELSKTWMEALLEVEPLAFGDVKFFRRRYGSGPTGGADNKEKKNSGPSWFGVTTIPLFAAGLLGLAWVGGVLLALCRLK
jgi:hypothetical protein